MLPSLTYSPLMFFDCRKVVHITEASLMDPWKIQFSLIRYHPRSYWMCSIPLLHPNTKILIVAAGSCSPIQTFLKFYWHLLRILIPGQINFIIEFDPQFRLHCFGLHMQLCLHHSCLILFLFLFGEESPILCLSLSNLS